MAAKKPLVFQDSAHPTYRIWLSKLIRFSPGRFCEGDSLPDSESYPPTRRPLLVQGLDAASEIDGAVGPITVALAYHQRTKHHLDRYAR